MVWQVTPSTILLILVVAVLSIAAFYVWRRHTLSAKIGTLLLLAAAVWMLGYGLELASVELTTKIFWNKIQYLGIAPIPGLWLIFTLQYSGREKWLRRRTVSLLAIATVIVVLTVFTNEFHGLIWKSVRLNTEDSPSTLVRAFGTGFWFFLTYAYILFLLGIFILIKMLIRSRRLYRWQAVLLIFSALVPLGGSVVEVVGLELFLPFRPVPFALIPTSLMAAWIFYRSRVENIMSASRKVVIEGMGDSVIVLDGENRVLDMNPAAQQLSDLAASKAIGQPVEELWPNWFDQIEHPDDGLGINREVVVNKDGKNYIYNVSISSLGERGGQFTNRVIVFHDITERKLAEEALRQAHDKLDLRVQERTVDLVKANEALQSEIAKRERVDEELKSSEEKFRALFEWAPDAFYLNDMRGVFVDGNRAAEKMSGYKKDELIGKSFLKLNLLPLNQIPKAVKLLAKNALGQPTGPDELTLNRKDGTRITMEIRTFPVKIMGQNLVLGIARDITERRRIEEELRESEERFRTIFESSPVGAALVNSKGKFTRISNSFQNMLGYNEDEFRGKSFRDITFEEDLNIGMEQFRETVGGKRNFFQVEKRYCRKDGEIIWGHTSVSTVRDSNGKFQYNITIIENITEPKRAEERIKAALKEKDILLKEIHHRVKNNLQIITSLLNLQSGYIQDEKTLEMLRESQDRIRSMAFIHEKLYRSGDLAQIHFDEYIRELTSHLVRSYGIDPEVIELKIQAQQILLDIDMAIPCGLIINELISNSLKHAFPDVMKGQICIDLHSVNHQGFQLTVSDNGMGFPRGLDFRNTQSLGLQLVNTLVEQLEGTIELDNDNGTTFEIRFSEIEH